MLRKIATNGHSILEGAMENQDRICHRAEATGGDCRKVGERVASDPHCAMLNSAQAQHAQLSGHRSPEGISAVAADLFLVTNGASKQPRGHHHTLSFTNWRLGVCRQERPEGTLPPSCVTFSVPLMAPSLLGKHRYNTRSPRCAGTNT